jgi:CRISPR-associated protein Cmr5
MAKRLDHQLAATAATVVPKRLSAEQRRRFRSLPAMIMTSGLAATGAFLLSKQEKPYQDAAWALLKDAAEYAKIAPGDNPNTTLDNISRESGHRYAIAEARARMFATWLARVASARPGKATPKDQPDSDDADPATGENGKS